MIDVEELAKAFNQKTMNIPTRKHGMYYAWVNEHGCRSSHDFEALSEMFEVELIEYYNHLRAGIKLEEYLYSFQDNMSIAYQDITMYNVNGVYKDISRW